MGRGIVKCLELALIVAVGFASAAPSDGNAEIQTEVEHLSDRHTNAQSKLLKFVPFLAVVSFPATQCTGNGNTGACVTKDQCTKKGGTDSMSPCAQGYGTCCIFNTMCRGAPGMVTVSNNLTHVMSGTINGTQQPCTITIPKQPGVCQLRVDFTDFNVGMVSQDGTGTCPSDTVSFTGAENLPNGLVLCGANTGQHLYLDYGNAASLTIQANLQAQSSKYDFLITMIKCDSPLKAPSGCTQYFTTGRGNVTSFNFPQQQLNSERYSVCVNSPGNSITWTPCTNLPNMALPFFITGNPIMPGMPPPPNCPTDFVLIPPNNRQCGSPFPTTTSTTKPFMMYVNFDDAEVMEEPQLNPDTGCPLGYTCNSPPIPPATTCPDLGSCIAPDWWSALVDEANTGFCLMYSVV